MCTTDGRRATTHRVNQAQLAWRASWQPQSNQTQFLHCANRTSEWPWRNDEPCITSKGKAEDELYDALREETDLTANLVQKGIRRAIDTVQNGVERLK
jgi:hypothetical protein